jgi:hypothetical protein
MGSGASGRSGALLAALHCGWPPAPAATPSGCLLRTLDIATRTQGTAYWLTDQHWAGAGAQREAQRRHGGCLLFPCYERIAANASVAVNLNGLPLRPVASIPPWPPHPPPPPAWYLNGPSDSRVQPGTAHYSLVQPGTARYSPVQPDYPQPLPQPNPKQQPTGQEHGLVQVEGSGQQGGHQGQAQGSGFDVSQPPGARVPSRQ